MPSGPPVWTEDDYAALGAFMDTFNRDLEESGELVETRGLARRSFPAGAA